MNPPQRDSVRRITKGETAPWNGRPNASRVLGTLRDYSDFALRSRCGRHALTVIAMSSRMSRSKAAVRTIDDADPRLVRMRRLAWLLDRSIPIGPYRVGLDPLIGLIPGRAT
ncbi:hypothetical protein ASA1KI_34170 [Opitutales bacterium ASA1]|nr:hypothetical protein ASA1KI_34170 [Opitutales bacterium ASA1]